MEKRGSPSEKRYEELQTELDRIVPELQSDKRVELILLFGSMAKGTVRRDSDIDMIVVKRTEKRFFDRLDELYRSIVPNVGLDLLVYTPEEFWELKNTRRFVLQALREGRILYEA